MSRRKINPMMNKERKLTLIVIALMCASLFMLSLWLSKGYGKEKLPIYLGVITVILILWITGMALIKKNNRNSSSK
jgi:hypothetical protein